QSADIDIAHVMPRCAIEPDGIQDRLCSGQIRESCGVRHIAQQGLYTEVAELPGVLGRSRERVNGVAAFDPFLRDAAADISAANDQATRGGQRPSPSRKRRLVCMTYCSAVPKPIAR